MNLKEQDIVKIGFFETNDDCLELVKKSFNANYVEYEINGVKMFLSISNYLSKIYIYLVDFISSIKENDNLVKFRILLIFYKSFKNIDVEQEMFLNYINIVVIASK